MNYEGKKQSCIAFIRLYDCAVGLLLIKDFLPCEIIRIYLWSECVSTISDHIKLWSSQDTDVPVWSPAQIQFFIVTYATEKGNGFNLILYPRTLNPFFLKQFYRCSCLSSFVLLVMVDLNTYPVSHKCGSGCELAWPGWAKPQRQSEPQSHDPSEAAGSAPTQQLHSLNRTNRAASKRSIFSVQ